jgi:multiple sugar transport system ATP-binding protein
LVEVKVDVTELLGREVVVHLTSEHFDLQGIFDPRTKAQVGNTIGVAFNMDSMHIFDKQTELAIR